MRFKYIKKLVEDRIFLELYNTSKKRDTIHKRHFKIKDTINKYYYVLFKINRIIIDKKVVGSKKQADAYLRELYSKRFDTLQIYFMCEIDKKYHYFIVHYHHRDKVKKSFLSLIKITFEYFYKCSNKFKNIVLNGATKLGQYKEFYGIIAIRKKKEREYPYYLAMKLCSMYLFNYKRKCFNKNTQLCLVDLNIVNKRQYFSIGHKAYTVIYDKNNDFKVASYSTPDKLFEKLPFEYMFDYTYLKNHPTKRFYFSTYIEAFKVLKYYNNVRKREEKNVQAE